MHSFRLFPLLLLLVATVLSAQTLPVREIAAPGWGRGGEDDLFGYALAIDGPQLIVGVPGAPTAAAAGTGMVEIYQPGADGLRLVQRLLPETNAIDEKFGVALAQSGDDLAVGSWDAGFGGGQTPGSVHMFQRKFGQWDSPLRLVAPGVDDADAFGSAVALSGDWLAVAAPGYDDDSGVRGAVFLYRRAGDGWAFAQRIDGVDASRPGEFGCAIAIAGERLYVGDCMADAAPVDDTGAVLWYRLDADGATFAGSVAAPELEAGDRYGYELAASATHLIIAATADAPSAQHGPRVYLFEYDGEAGHALQLEQPLPSFAVRLQLSPDRALVAGPVCASTTTPGRAISCVRRFDYTGTWSESAAYLQTPEVGYQGFGWALAADGTNIHVGNPFRDVAAGPASGAVSTFDAAMPSLAATVLELPASLWRFAFNTVVDGNTMVATDSRLATLDDFDEGAAWIFDTGPGAPLLARLDSPEPSVYERFASDVGVDGDLIVLSALKRAGNTSTLVLRTYRRDGDAIAFVDEFDVFSLPVLQPLRVSVGIQMSGGRIALRGDLRTQHGFAPRIAVLLRQGETWQLEALLEPPAQEGEVALNFSRLVMHGDRIALLRGETRTPPGEPRGWVAFVYRRSGSQWQLEATLRPDSDGPAATALHDIALGVDELVISTGDTLQNTLVSRLHTFAFDGIAWTDTGIVEQPPGVEIFGRQLAIEGGLMVVESFPLTPIAGNFVYPLLLYRRDGDRWDRVSSFLPSLAPAGQGRLFDFGNPQLADGRLFAAGRREGPGITVHTHGVMFEFDARAPLFADGLE